MKNYTAYLFVVLCLLTEALVYADPRFDRWDGNSDGKLIKEELPPGLQHNFSRVDTDGDGAISKTEHLNFIRRRSVMPAKTSEGVTLIPDIAYAVDGHERQKLDLLLPKVRPSKSLPVLVFIHGGGWRQGQKEAGHHRLTALVKNGNMAGISVGYRLSAHAIWPAQIHDCKGAIRWIRGNAQKYNLDPTRIVVWGTSAGGHLVTMLGVSGDVAALEGEVGGNLNQSSRVQGVVNFFGPSDLLTMNDFPGKMDHNAPDSPESLLIGAPIQANPDKARFASPLHFVTEDDAPFLHAHGTNDQLVPFNQSEVLHAALKKAGVSSELLAVKDGGHGFKDPAVDARLAAFLKRVLFTSRP